MPAVNDITVSPDTVEVECVNPPDIVGVAPVNLKITIPDPPGAP